VFQHTIWFLSTQATAKHRVFPSGAASSSLAPPPHSGSPLLHSPSSSFAPSATMLEAPGTAAAPPRMRQKSGDAEACCPPGSSHPYTLPHSASLSTGDWGIVLKNRRCLDWSLSRCSARRVSLRSAGSIQFGLHQLHPDAAEGLQE